MKKIYSVLLIVSMLFCLAISVSAKNSVEVYVSISDGNLKMSTEKITVTDSDGDGDITINDALYNAHEAKYAGGAEAGYASSQGAYGLKIDMLWGVSQGDSFGYYINNQSAMSLGDSVKDGDYVYAFVYTDLETWSDTYSFFDVTSKNATEGETVEITLSAAGYDEMWNPVTVKLKNATITVNGEKTSAKTDENGKAVLTFDKKGNYVISAVSDEQTLVPPVCKISVSEKEAVAPDDNAKPGDTYNGSFVILSIVSALFALAILKKVR